ncbi:MAG: ATP-binding protein [Candidatus Cloacimonetes bacterium]|nr:ATP-binding protein [Candidatus Cloacimonadota bacterium]
MHFNTAGPVNQPDAYKIDPLTRWDTEEILGLIDEKKYIILHAPRQTGKTSCLLALRDYLNKEGKYFAVYVNFEVGQAWRHDIKKATDEFMQEILSRMRAILKDEFPFHESIAYYKALASSNSLNDMLEYLSNLIKKPIVMFIDEIDALIGDTLISVLRQLRAGYDKRPENFPSTIILCGVRDIKDYRIHTSNQEIITGGSAFNIKTVSLRLGNFSKDEVIELYSQHTRETGQVFAEDCFDLVMEYTDGQPWLVNALAREVTHNMKENRDRSIIITAEMIERAKERLILGRQTHLDQLADKLKEVRVRNVVLPLVMGQEFDFSTDDEQYCIDLGLIKKENKTLQLANGIYKEIIPRELTSIGQDNFAILSPKWIAPDGSICVRTLLTMFKDFWNENSGMVVCNIPGYKEAVPQLFLQAYLQRVVNGGGYINREYGLGRKRTDLHIKWMYTQITNDKSLIACARSEITNPQSSPNPSLRGSSLEYPSEAISESGDFLIQNIIIELKIIKKGIKYSSLLKEALPQTAHYAQINGCDEAHLIIFDRDKSQWWRANQKNEIVKHDGVKIEIWKLGRGSW